MAWLSEGRLSSRHRPSHHCLRLPSATPFRSPPSRRRHEQGWRWRCEGMPLSRHHPSRHRLHPSLFQSLPPLPPSACRHREGGSASKDGGSGEEVVVTPPSLLLQPPLHCYHPQPRMGKAAAPALPAACRRRPGGRPALSHPTPLSLPPLPLPSLSYCPQPRVMKASAPAPPPVHCRGPGGHPAPSHLVPPPRAARSLLPLHPPPLRYRRMADSTT